MTCAVAVYDAFEHWKSLVKLLCFCEDALLTHKDLFTSFICELTNTQGYMYIVYIIQWNLSNPDRRKCPD